MNGQTSLLNSIIASVRDDRETISLEQKREKLRERQAYLYERWKDFNLFIVECLGWQNPAFHQQLDYYGMRLAPRGHGKSWRGNVAETVHKLGYFPDIRQLIISEAMNTGKLFLAYAKGIIDDNELYRFVYGDLNGEKVGRTWNQDQITISTRKKVLLEPSVTVLAVGTAIVGRHFDRIICDDIVSDQNQSTQQQREKVRRWYSVSLKPCLEPDNVYNLDHTLIINGTRYHPDDLYSHLMQGEFKNDYVVFQAINEDEDGNEYALWEEKFPLGKGEKDEDCDPKSTLRGIRFSNGTVYFELQYQNNADLLHGQIFHLDWLKEMTFEQFEEKRRALPEHFFVETADFTTKEKENNDFYAGLVFCRFNDNTTVVCDGRHFRGSIIKQAKAVKEMYDLYLPNRVGTESTGFQTVVPELSEDLKNVPCEGIDTKKSKEFRARRAAIPCEQGRVYFLTDVPLIKKLRGELVLFPELDFDDLPDAFFMYFDLYNAIDLPDILVLTGGQKCSYKGVNVPDQDLYSIALTGGRRRKPLPTGKPKGRVDVRHA